MGVAIIFSPEALTDLEDIVRFIAQDDPVKAEEIGLLLIDRVAILQKHPFLGSAYRKRAGVRKLLSSPFIIFYRVNHDQTEVQIIRYWHASRSEPNLL